MVDGAVVVSLDACVGYIFFVFIHNLHLRMPTLGPSCHLDVSLFMLLPCLVYPCLYLVYLCNF